MQKLGFLGCGAILLVVVVVGALVVAGGYNSLVAGEESVKSAWAQVENVYQRRADLIPNLVATVQGFAQQEKDVLIGVTNARAKVGSVQATPETLNDPQAMKNFSQAQGELSGALSRLLVVVERYPELKSDQNFRNLQAQLEGTENRITTARNRFIKAVQEYNVLARQFPTNLTAMMFGYKTKASLEFEDAKTIAEPPKVDFKPAPAATPAPAPATPPAAAPTTAPAPAPAPKK